jgi:glycosyltransferase involved in cell wall biosynthesis
MSTESGQAPAPIRVLRVFSRLNVGGPSVHVILLTAGLAERGYTTRLVVGREAPWEGNCLDLAAERGVAVEMLEGLGREIRPLDDLRAFVGLLRIIRQFRPHVLHTHASKAGLLGRVAAVLGRVPVVVHTYHGHVLRGYFGRLRTLAFRGAERVLAAASDAVVAVSDSVRDDLLRLGVAPAAKVRVVPLGLDLEPLSRGLPRGSLRGESGASEDAPLVGIVGRLAPIKDVGVFLEAAAIVRRTRPAVRFAVVGDGEERASLEELARRLALDGVVHFHGWRRDMRPVYGDLDVVVNASRNEGTPVALLEALAAARPVVATEVGGTPDVLSRGSHGVLVPPADPSALAAGILATLSGPEEAHERARRGQAHVLEHYAAARLVRDVDALYRGLLKVPGRGVA